MRKTETFFPDGRKERISQVLYGGGCSAEVGRVGQAVQQELKEVHGAINQLGHDVYGEI